MIDDGGPAFPNNDQHGCAFSGMTLRDWFAGMALSGAMVTAQGLGDIAADERTRLLNQLGKLLYEVSDAMLAAREGNQTETN